MAIHKLKIFACRGSESVAAKIAKSYGVELGDLTVSQFSDGEFQPAFNESIRGCTVFIVQSTPPPTENLMELLLTIDAARRASAHMVVAVMPYFGWARQDRKDRPRVPIGAKLVANLLSAAGCDRVITIDLHADQIHSRRPRLRIEGVCSLHQESEIGELVGCYPRYRWCKTCQ